jgi:hypothetical protein
MHKPTHMAPNWNTASMGRTANMSRLELCALTEHFTACCAIHDRLQAMQNGLIRAQGLVSARFMTVALGLALIAAVVHLAL